MSHNLEVLWQDGDREMTRISDKPLLTLTAVNVSRAMQHLVLACECNCARATMWLDYASYLLLSQL